MTNAAATLNLLNAGRVWIERRGLAPEVVLVVGFTPRASLGVWQPGQDVVRVEPELADPEVEVLEAAAPVVQAALEQLDDPQRAGLVEVLLRQGVKLELLVEPIADRLELRVADATRAVNLAFFQLPASLH